MGNLISCRASITTGGKLVLSDGTIQEFDPPISVAELMLEHPQQFVIDVNSLTTACGTKVTPLPADCMLDPGKVYAIVPMTRGRNSLFPGNCATGDEEVIEKEKATKADWSTEVFEQPEYLSREFSIKGWKPSLRTIEEKWWWGGARHRRAPQERGQLHGAHPLWFLDRAALVHPNRPSVIHGPVRFTWADTYRRCRRLASALATRSIGPGSTVAVIAPNVPAMYEAHFGVPMAGAAVNCVNVRLNASTIAFLLDHSSAEVVMVDQEFFSLAEESLQIISNKKKNSFKPPLLIVVGDQTCDPKSLHYALSKGAIEYEKFLESGDPDYNWKPQRMSGRV
uniref:AMP-dependent synthetase/ligase domain-containing protein n=1 Tax=Ananas comosus var. bracteatus TaxID=296719 RepID=A0A6V7PD53_ANACO|nr:unnamed protein product [Ananas comosus var. bracteatus]